MSTVITPDDVRTGDTIETERQEGPVTYIQRFKVTGVHEDDGKTYVSFDEVLHWDRLLHDGLVIRLVDRPDSTEFLGASGECWADRCGDCTLVGCECGCHDSGDETLEYLVSWVIDIEARTPLAAAQKALTIQRRSTSEAVVFDVTDTRNGATRRVDLMGPGDE